jgi:hypothetical protein
MRHERLASTDPDRDLAALRREHRRLRRAFAALLFALAPPAMLAACGQPGSPDVAHDDDAGADAQPSGDVAAPPDTGPDTGPDVDCTLSSALLDAGADVEPSCVYTLPCGVPPALTVVGCDLYTGPNGPLGCSVMQDAGCLADAYVAAPGAPVQILCIDCLGGGGRRPQGLARVRAICAPTAIGGYFARMAHDEAASVHAFHRMRDELAAHGAPSALVRAAERSARDEVRHARAMARHARRHGAMIPAPRVRRCGPRSLEAIARENAVEGCVLETFGALIAAWQAAHAPDPALRRTFARIAADEARHAALAWAVARWSEDRLGTAARARTAAARTRALRSLRRSVRARSPAFEADLGWPDAAGRTALLEGMIEQFELV